jgi:predicted lipoprotein with Yx(FWY)xxD motif
MTDIPTRHGRALVVAMLVVAAVLAAISAPSAMARRGVTITTRQAGSYGRVLVDGRGLPLYYFTRDKGTASRCYGTCAAAWPVTFAKGTPVARGGVKQRLLGRQRRSDGRFQATYAGHALYTYVSDSPGVALCHDVREFGGLWLLLRSSGRRVS